FFGSTDALEKNVEMEFQRNRERYEFLRWGQKALANFRAVPPNVGIVHQVNLEYLANVVFLGKDQQGVVAFPDSLVGTDSHTTMSNMAPEYGATIGFFPVDTETLNYLRATGRSKEQVELVERYCKEQGLFRSDAGAVPTFSKTLSLDLSTVEPSLAGPKRPQ